MNSALPKMLLYSLLSVFLTMGGCATTPKAPLVFRPGATVETLTASVGLSVKTSAGGTGGNGYMIYQKPDRFRMVMLTPFGTTALDFSAGGDTVCLAIPSKGTAYTGSFADLPDRSGLQTWRLMKWAVEGDPLYNPAEAGSVVRTEAAGRNSLAFYNSEGVLERKLTEDGNEVKYRDYQSIDGVPFPSIIEFSDSRGVKVKISLEEPEINQPLQESALTPQLQGLKILPLSEFPGM